MGRLFRARRKSNNPVGSRSEAATVVKDLSDLVNSCCPHTDVQSNRDSQSFFQAPFQSSDRADELFTSEAIDSQRQSATPCRCNRCSHKSEQVKLTGPHKRRTVQRIECHIDSNEQGANGTPAAGQSLPPRTATEELLVALTICLGSCICAHLIFDTVIGLEQFRWMDGLTKTIKLSVVLYVILRANRLVIKLTSKVLDCLRSVGAKISDFGRSLPRLLISTAACPSNQLAVKIHKKAPLPKRELTASAPPAARSADHLMREISTQLPAVKTSSSSECENLLQRPVIDDAASWDLEVPAEGPMGQLHCYIQGKIRVTELQ